MYPIAYFYIFLTALFTSLIMIPPLSNLALRIGTLDRPDERKIHVCETPRLGGIAIFAALILAILLHLDIDLQSKGFLAGAIIIFLTGLADDLTNLTPRQKLVGELVAAGVALAVSGLWINTLGDPFDLGSIYLIPFFAIPFSIIAFVGVINAINLLDGLDGLAAGVSGIACGAFAILSYINGNAHLFGLSIALFGGIIGFLRYNSFPAKIFMGDGGSLLLGYSLAFFSVQLVIESRGSVSPWTPVVILGVPIIDTLVVITGRLRRRQKIFSPDNSHIHHRLLDLGIGHKHAVIIVYVFSYFLSLFAVLGHKLPDWILAFSLLLVASGFYFFVKVLSDHGSKTNFTEVDSNEAIVDTGLYRKIVSRSHLIKDFIKYILIIILLLAFTVPAPGRNIAMMSGCVALLLASLVFFSREAGNKFLLFVLYFSGAFIIYQIENKARAATVLGIPVLSVSTAAFLILFAVEGIKVFLRKRTTQLVSSPLEYLILFIVVSVPLLPGEFVQRYHLLTVASKSVVMFVAYKLILMREAGRNRKILLATCFALVSFVVRYNIG